MRVKFGNVTKDVPLLEVTAENYIVPVGEEDTYHCRIEQIQFNRNNGKRESKPRIQKFEAKMFPMVCRNLKQQGYTIDVLYDPTNHLNELAKKEQEKREMTYQQRKEQEAKRKEEEKKALKAEILAELKAQGLLNTAKGGAKGGKAAKGGKDGDKTDAPE
jgi:ribosomal protein S8